MGYAGDVGWIVLECEMEGALYDCEFSVNARVRSTPFAAAFDVPLHVGRAEVRRADLAQPGFPRKDRQLNV